MTAPSTRCGGPFAAVGRFSFRHRRWVLGAWTLLLVAGLVFGTRVFDTAAPTPKAAGSESATGSALLAAADPTSGGITALVQGRPVDDPEVRAAVTAAAADLGRIPGVGTVTDAYSASGAAALRSADGRAGLIQVDLTSSGTGTLDAASQRLKEIAADAPGATVQLGGEQVLTQQVQQQTEKDTERGEFITLPVTLLVMVLIFGGFVAAGLPLIGAIASIGGAFLALLGFTRIMPIDTSVLPIATVLGLGLSIDYALLMVNRFREERSHGADMAAAVERTSATAGRTIAFSALTVAAALSGLFVFVSPIFRAVGAAGVSVVVITVLSGLTLVPALLGFAGGKIKAPLRPEKDDGVFARTVRRVQRRPLPVALGVAGVLLAMAAPFAFAHPQNADADVLPTSFSSRAVADALDSRFPALQQSPITVAVQGDRAQAEAYAAHIRELPGVSAVSTAAPTGRLVAVGVDVRGGGEGATAQQVVRELRADRDGLTTYVTGDAATVVDFKHEVASRGPWALGLVAAATFLLLFLMTGSVVVPLKALAMNMLSLGASLGVLTLVFQDGWLSSLLGFSPTGGLEAWIPVLVFAFAFGLSMDYEVFLLSRIKELHEQGHPCRRAVELGVQRSGRIITSAGLLMVIVFAGFSTGDMLDIKEIGLALAVAVLVDATLVRMLLVPATMTLFGNRNWWAPGWLRRLHARVGLHDNQTLPPLEVVPPLPAPREPESAAAPALTGPAVTPPAVIQPAVARPALADA
ncbi:MMPL family transporter [Streptacidiphilus sp. PB12-B1b]|uniref:MMPL family transporter n=1 Tax=Streptacidiphilus sp. PB12-B1b TaxID=2705012 RepID=UPI0015FCF7F6|nr:MMPL family transporter [Streptacidiphilus sp. PB12-B1b]QMU75965.1 MMPL family transporter [Streptacidiphilus sp. PB12-B1b]